MGIKLVIDLIQSCPQSSTKKVRHFLADIIKETPNLYAMYNDLKAQRMQRSASVFHDFLQYNLYEWRLQFKFFF
jgi:hypothetical protein